MKNFLESVSGAVSSDPDSEYTIDKALESIRAHLGMEIAYLSEFVDDKSVFRAVSAPGLEEMVKVGDEHSLEDVYCEHILEGRLPELIPDTSLEPVAAGMPITKAVPIGSHMSIPIKRPDGSMYGMFCCLSSKPNPSLNNRDLEMMRIFAELATVQVAKDIDTRDRYGEKRRRISEILENHAITMVYQPIWQLDGEQPIGVEALSRFETEPRRTPDIWFAEAEETGQGLALELCAIDKVRTAFNSLPEQSYVSVNISPETALTTEFSEVIAGLPLDRLVLEITEHARVNDYEVLTEALAEFRKAGVRIAVDDAGAGYSSLRHIVQLSPDIIKLDMSLTRDIDRDRARRSLAHALIYFARETGSQVTAEGIETQGEADTLKTLGVHYGQGYLFGRPDRLENVQSVFAVNAMTREKRIA